MARKVSDAKSITIVVDKDVVKGELYFNPNNGWGGIVPYNAKAGEEVVFDISHSIVEVPVSIVAGTSMVDGDKVYYDAANDRLANEGDIYVGKSVELYSSGDNSGGAEDIEINLSMVQNLY